MPRPKGFKVSEETRERMRQVQLAKLAGPDGDAIRARLKAMSATANARRAKPLELLPDEKPLLDKFRAYFGSSTRAREELARMRRGT